ncbi:polyprenyl synthetase [Macrophomina phaseolina]|uniref:Polyprenyl synthetase n=1 Tax=Macrophomina phaseolina TaxID=35725 RepID=A0ABQ8GH35_9PEZI|nr:polyprenyl synthetase [Macrophomina phaseolina]
MPYFSTPLPAELVRRSGSLTRFETVIHKHNQICTEAAERVLDEFNEAMGTDIVPRTIADIPGLGRMHAIAFTIPNCLPERLAVLTRFAEFTILNDDFYDTAKIEEIDAVNDHIQSVLKRETSSITNATKSKQFQSSILLDMMNIDGELALDIMNTYSNGLALATFAPDTLQTLDEYLPVRLINSGLDVFQTMSCFGMGIKLSPQEKEELKVFLDTAMFSTTLINDFHSWPKEIKHHIETPGSERPFNAVAILMRHSGCSEEEALQKLREKQVEIQEQHLALLRKLQSEKEIPEDHMLYILAAQYAASGSEFWSIHVPRYPSKEDLNQPEVEFVDGAFRTWVVVEPNATVCKLKESTMPNGNCTTNEHASSNELASANGHTATSGRSAPTGQAGSHLPIVLAPYKYLTSLPSKGIRDIFIAALNWWLEVPEDTLTSIKAVIGMLHQSSLMYACFCLVAEELDADGSRLDDIEDDSKLRRGSPSTHMIYGKGQTINSANYIFVQAFAEMQRLKSPEATEILINEVENLHCGQSFDLYWKYHVQCPSEEEYMMMVDNKTGGLFRLCVRLMQAESTRKYSSIDSTYFVTLLSRYFQIRDDYQNLMSDQYAKEKGFAEDLDEGKISLPLIYCLQSPACTQSSEIMGILKHKASDTLPPEMKHFILNHMRSTGALESTHGLLQEMQNDLLGELRRLEGEFGSQNPTLELVLRKLWV